ncbi:MAG: hypothetical protein Q7U98_04625 [Methylicorpusculum sp.]|uniref:hypothetical protein n=1 Tax=Methylicorpusculum sp. TaxID=2713644 RepID=UPI00271B7F80|nr:hypothetical protein [Methylicorpusculum sp.]MDO8846688.1 hypothetical protein [Methylicorpusculum sp.]MDO8938419.1 hypothetical protein [Methylicorpusculum sp.]MDO9241578.1 hypothetical protein [Methylicorpusculum sp.]MDP2177802.1 hypothetical protein [Methylicorpusculum sp.]MDP2202609.1 hypothetical protein [Methylicorpusculum sp.]
MNKLNVGLVRLFQFIVFVVFVFVVIVYFGAMVLLPLDAIVMLIKLFSLIGLNGFISAFIAIPAVGYLGLIVYKTPGLCKLVVDTGVELITLGKAKVEAFNAIADSVKS